MTTWFVTGTDTDVGKTVFTGLFARELIQKKRHVITQKWVQTGCDPEACAPDIAEHRALMGDGIDVPENIRKAMCPYQFKWPASPHLAAEHEGTKIQIPKITASLQYLQEHYDDVVVEGLGGLMVPLTPERTLLDLIEQLKLQVILVVKNKVGAINHALLSLEALANREIPIAGFVVNTVDPALDQRIADDNIHTIERLSGVRLMGVMKPNKMLELQ